MNSPLKIYCKNIGRHVEIAGGETLSEIFDRLRDEISMRPICARVNNRAEDLSFPVYAPKQVEFMDASSPTGHRTAVRSLCFLLYKAVAEALPEARLRIEHSVSRGYFCRLSYRDSGEAIIPDEALTGCLLKVMRRLVEEKIPFVRKERLTSEVIDYYRAQGLDDKVLLLESFHELYTVFYRLGDTCDSYYSALAPDTSFLSVFDLRPYDQGMLLLGPDPEQPSQPLTPLTQHKLNEAFNRYLAFNRIIKISNVGELNVAIKENRAGELINVAEAMHGKQFDRIADEITARNEKGGARFVFIAGPSSSGKTTSAKRLGIELMTNLKTPKLISLDDYFVDREHTPRDIDGGYDFESLYALDLERFHSDLRALRQGKTINLPTYSFERGGRVDRERPLRLDRDDILLIEGIHGLNPELTAGINPDDVFKVYVSALTTLSIDDHNWIPTTDNRLLRRIVRDHKYRNTSALDTLRRWASVRRGEERWIFPYQENADATFNSSLLFELAVMKPYAEPLLRNVPHNVPEYAEAYRLLRFLSHFEPLEPEQIPSTSLLREFLGGSSFHY